MNKILLLVLVIIIQDAGHSLLKRLLTCKEVPDGAPACKEVVLAWLCLAAELNMDRTAMGERGLSGPSMMREMTAGVCTRSHDLFLCVCEKRWCWHGCA